MPDIVIIPDSGLINFYYSDTNNPIATAVVSGENLVFLSQSGQINIQDLKVSGSLDTSSLSTTSSVNTSDYLLVEQNGFINRSTVTNAQYKFPSDLTVSLTNNRTFGRYVNGAVIPASGKTPAEVIGLAIVEPISPTVTLTSSTTIPFNQTAISNVLNFTHTINSLNSTISSASLEWRRNDTGSWNVLSTSTGTPGTSTHSLTDTSFNAQPFNYRRIVTDNVSASTTGTLNISPAAYVAPTISFTVTGPNTTSPETSSIREKGNVSSSISGLITKRSNNVDLTNYIIQYSVDNGSWTNIGSPISISSSPHTIAPTGHNPTANKTASNIRYQIIVNDQFQATTSSASTINFYNMIFYGPSSTNPTTSSDIRSLPNKALNISATNPTNPFTFNTGSTDKYYSIVLPSGSSSPFGLLTQALNTTTNFDTTSQFILNNVSVNDYDSTATSYRRYTHVVSEPYGNNNFSITRS
jgi:hypothetical protein